MSDTYVTYKLWDGCSAPSNLESGGRLVGQIVRAVTVDKNALLALADILGSTRETDCRGCRLEGAGCAECSSGVAHEAARRIREACGEVAQ